MKTFFLTVLLASFLVGCAGTPKISAMHDPLYRAENHTSTITARARESTNGIKGIVIDAVVGEVAACSGFGSSIFGAVPSLIPCRTNATAMSVLCTFADVKTEVTCSLPIAITPRRLISYTARTWSATNKTASSGSVTYAAGENLTQNIQVRLGFITITMPWEPARPVIWRTDSPSSATNRADRIDFGFVPDADMPNYRAFTDDLQPLVLSLFYTDTNQFSAWTRTWKNLFNIWAGPIGADGEGCTRTFNNPAATVRGAFDGTAILHRNAFRDCASLTRGGGGAGTTETGLADATWVLMHEAGHFLFGLGDEYVGGGNSAVSLPKNVYGTQSTCQSNSTANSVPPSQCTQIGMTGTWRNDDGQVTTMEDRALNSDFRTLSGVAMSNMVTACVDGACY